MAAALQLVCNGCAAGESVVSFAKAPERSSSSSALSSAVQGKVYRRSRSNSISVVSSGASSRAAGFILGATSVHGGVRFSAHASSSSLPSEQRSLQENRFSRRSIQINSSKNGATNATSNSKSMTNAGAATELDWRIEEETRKPSVNEDDDDDDLVSLTGAPACSMPNFSMIGNSVIVFNPLTWLPNSIRRAIKDFRPLLLYVPGMDGTGQGIYSQLSLCEAGGHTALFEDSINLVDIMHANGFTQPAQSNGSPPLSSNISPPSPVAKREEAVADEAMDEMGLILEPWRVLTSPLVSGTENLPMPSSEPRRPVLFVGNHTMFGFYDSPVLVYELYLRGFRCRGLAHPGHWLTGAGAIFERYGNVKATKMAAYRLLKEGETVLLFPGGAREVCKRKGEEYKLFWKETADFVRMATRHEAIIVPFGALGGDEAFDILYDGSEIRASLIGPLVEEAYIRAGLDPENVYPITSLPGTKIPSPIPIPSIERIYFHFAEPVDTLQYANSNNDRAQVQSVYDMVRERVEDSVELLKVIRSKDPERELPARLLAMMGRLLPEFLPRMAATTVQFPKKR